MLPCIAENTKQFDALTTAADELMSAGFEDIYQDTKEKIQASIAM